MLLKMEKDKEMMWKKQVCVGFGPKVGSFPILVPGRFLLHEGEVLMIEKKKKKKVSVSNTSAHVEERVRRRGGEEGEERRGRRGGGIQPLKDYRTVILMWDVN